jgi:hypothetical protein
MNSQQPGRFSNNSWFSRRISVSISPGILREEVGQRTSYPENILSGEKCSVWEGSGLAEGFEGFQEFGNAFPIGSFECGRKVGGGGGRGARGEG